MKALLQHTTDWGKSAFVRNGPIGICGHQAWQLSFLLSLVPPQCSQVPFLKETAVTSPNSLNKYSTKWKMGYPETFQSLRRGSHRREEPWNESYGLFSGWHQGCSIFHVPNPLGSVNTFTYFPKDLLLRLCSFHPWRPNTSENWHSSSNRNWSHSSRKGVTQRGLPWLSRG